MQDETVGWVKSIHETKYGELLGLIMVGPHVTDMIEAGVVALDAEATVETVADGIAPHPTLSEAIKEAGSRRARVGLSISRTASRARKRRRKRSVKPGSGGPRAGLRAGTLRADILVPVSSRVAARGRPGTAFPEELPPAGRLFPAPFDSLVSVAIVNRRNAIVGWLALKIGKVLARKQAKKLSRKLPFGRKKI